MHTDTLTVFRDAEGRAWNLAIDTADMTLAATRRALMQVAARAAANFLYDGPGVPLDELWHATRVGRMTQERIARVGVNFQFAVESAWTLAGLADDVLRYELRPWLDS